MEYHSLIETISITSELPCGGCMCVQLLINLAKYGFNKALVLFNARRVTTTETKSQACILMQSRFENPTKQIISLQLKGLHPVFNLRPVAHHQSLAWDQPWNMGSKKNGKPFYSILALPLCPRMHCIGCHDTSLENL